MKKIGHAQFLRSIETEGHTTAEVEFAWEGDFGADVKDERYVAILKKQGEGEYDVERIVKDNSEFALDWYENIDHEAFEDVTDQVFSSGQNKEDKSDRADFVKEVLDFEGVSEDMESRRKQTRFF